MSIFGDPDQRGYMPEPAKREAKGVGHSDTSSKRRRTKHTSVSASTVTRSNLLVSVIIGIVIVGAIGGLAWLGWTIYMSG